MDTIADPSPAWSSSIPSAIYRLRKRLRLTQDELGEKLSVKGNTVWRYERGSIKPPPETLLILKQMAEDAGLSDPLLDNSGDDGGTFLPQQTEVSACIRAIRRRMGLNQIHFAKLINAGHKTISQYETGRAKPSAPQVIKMLSLSGRQHGAHPAENPSLINFLGEELGLSINAVIALIDAELEDIRSQNAKIQARLQALDEEEKRPDKERRMLSRRRRKAPAPQNRVENSGGGERE